MDGTSIKSLLADPATKWNQPAISTFLKNNHAVCTDEWRYIRYADGSEELYNEKSDPFEWDNQASKPELKKIKDDLAKFLPTVNAPPVARTGKKRANKKN